ncbi:hypothetical protein T12_6719 [Trichinella patagoniensis]|uniref:Uncharacterized protein n=1 Tax=Trichinella patagoniensis TaxID=990121 RepID=A0A0V0ZH77_9BILA|nr:hypothetical protein T12_6719 [Trichinella patagoniensis]
MARAFAMVPAASRVKLWKRSYGPDIYIKEEPDQKDREIERAEGTNSEKFTLNFVDDSISYQARAFSLRP